MNVKSAHSQLQKGKMSSMKNEDVRENEQNGEGSNEQGRSRNWAPNWESAAETPERERVLNLCFLSAFNLSCWQNPCPHNPPTSD